VDGRDKPGHDEKATRFQAVNESLKMLAAFSVRLSGRRITLISFVWPCLSEAFRTFGLQHRRRGQLHHVVFASIAD
jgi:hypothetical protein